MGEGDKIKVVRIKCQRLGGGGGVFIRGFFRGEGDVRKILFGGKYSQIKLVSS
jgi:hypothetical protein